MAEPKDKPPLRLWFWKYTDSRGRRRISTWRMDEETAAGYKDAVKVEGSLEIRRDLGGTTGSLMSKLPPRKDQGR